MEKVFADESHSLLGVAGVAGFAVDMVRLFAVELENYEKFEGIQLSLTAKANRLAAIPRHQLPHALQGLSAVPVFAGVTPSTLNANIFSYDVLGEQFEESHWCSIGTGSPYVTTTLQRLWTADATPVEAIDATLQDLIEASTAGPDPRRDLYPLVYVVTGDGVTKIEPGVRRGQPVVFTSALERIVSLTHNASTSLFKLSEIYDRIFWGELFLSGPKPSKSKWAWQRSGDSCHRPVISKLLRRYADGTRWPVSFRGQRPRPA